MINYSDIEEVIDKCFNEMNLASIEKYDSERADRTAALFLVAQMKVSMAIEAAELSVRQSKNEISRIEGEKYFEYKTANTDKKITENMLTSFISKETSVVGAKTDNAKQEANLKKWTFILNTLKDGHIYFRNISKTKGWSE